MLDDGTGGNTSHASRSFHFAPPRAISSHFLVLFEETEARQGASYR